MPPQPVVVGQEFQWTGGGSVTLFATVLHVSGLPYTVRAVQTGTDVAILTILRDPQPDMIIELPLSVGSTTLVSSAQSTALGAPFQEVRSSVSLSIRPGP